MKKYKTIVIDPPWKTHAGMTSAVIDGKRRPTSKLKANLDYPTMTIEQIMDLPVDKLSENEAHLFLWTINSQIENAYKLVRAWGFKPSTLLVWCKNPRPLLGDNFSINTEYCIYARKPNAKLLKKPKTNWWIWKRGIHSQKPEDFQDLLEEVSPAPYLELFARRKRFNWDVWGNEVENDIDFSPHPKKEEVGEE